jgi:hypothetical protein
VTVQGAGGFGIGGGQTVGTGTCIAFSGAVDTFAFQLGNSTSALSYFPAMADLAISLNTEDTGGVQFLCSVNGSARNIFVFNPATTNQGQVGFLIGIVSGTAPSVSSFFNTLTNCYAQYMNAGYVFNSGTGTFSTQTTFLQCSAYGSSDGTAAYGVEFAEPEDGLGSTFVGCYFENFKYGVYLNQTDSVTFCGTQFEGCTSDIRWSGSDTGVSFVGLYDYTQTGTPALTCGVLNGTTPTTGTQTATFSASNKPGTSATAPSAWLPVYGPNASVYYIPLWQ